MRFEDGTRRLGAAVGHGVLRGSLAVDQIYALAIESGFWRTGPLAGVTNRPRHGGKTHALRDAFTDNGARYMRNLAHRALEDHGLEHAMAENMEDAAASYRENAPRETTALANSGHPVVTSEGIVVYDRSPVVARLSREELKRRDELVPRRHFGRGARR